MKTFKQWLFSEPEQGFMGWCNRHITGLVIFLGALVLIAAYLYLHPQLWK